MFRVSLIAGLALCSLPLANAEAPADHAAGFIGQWQIAFQEAEGVIVNEPTASCDNPAVIKSLGDDMISVSTPKGDWGQWQVRDFGGRNPWWQIDPETGDTSYTLVAVWKADDRFILADRFMGGIKYDYENAKEWTRCRE